MRSTYKPVSKILAGTMVTACAPQRPNILFPQYCSLHCNSSYMYMPVLGSKHHKTCCWLGICFIWQSWTVHPDQWWGLQLLLSRPCNKNYFLAGQVASATHTVKQYQNTHWIKPIQCTNLWQSRWPRMVLPTHVVEWYQGTLACVLYQYQKHALNKLT